MNAHDHAIENLEREMARRKGQKNLKHHPTRKMLLKAGYADIDEDMMPVIQWMNDLGIQTLFCCQGDINTKRKEIHQKPYVLWKCRDELTVRYIVQIFTEFHIHSAIPNGPDGHIRHMFHEIRTKVDFFENDLRYSSEWYDNIALKDFIQFLSSYLQKQEEGVEYARSLGLLPKKG